MVDGKVALVPIMAGEPITDTKIVSSSSTGFMAATLQPGMRAASIPVSIASVAGGFIQPNNHVDVILTETSNDSSKHVTSRVVLSDVRVLAIDQTVTGKGPAPDAKTVTLELSASQVQTLARAQASGALSLALRSLSDHGAAQVAVQQGAMRSGDEADGGQVSIIRYGIVRNQPGSGGN
jgi:pilus assembly protein CpaB